MNNIVGIKLSKIMDLAGETRLKQTQIICLLGGAFLVSKGHESR